MEGTQDPCPSNFCSINPKGEQGPLGGGEESHISFVFLDKSRLKEKERDEYCLVVKTSTFQVDYISSILITRIINLILPQF